MTKRGHPRYPSGIRYDVEMEKFDVKGYLKNLQGNCEVSVGSKENKDR